MPHTAGENLYAVRQGAAWLLQPLGPPAALAAGGNAVAVRAADGAWTLVPAAPPAGRPCLTVPDAAGAPLLWPVGRRGEEDGGGGEHPLCSVCDAAAPLATAYTVSLSGLPAVCGADAFNGVWTLTHDGDCNWSAQISASRVVELTLLSRWAVTWRDTAPGGPSGDFGAAGAEPCRPETALWTPENCLEPFGCWGLCSSYLTDAACVVAAAG
jgi:hypothetical protein